VQFIVDPAGNISNVHTIDVPTGCKPCGKEAIRIIKNGPNWQPAYQENKPVIYQAIQKITWQVSEE
jgi:protein TonB